MVDELDRKINLQFSIEATQEAIYVREFLNMIGVVSQENVEEDVLTLYFIESEKDIPVSRKKDSFALFLKEDLYEKYGDSFSKSTCVTRGWKDVLKDLFGVSEYLNTVIPYYVEEELYYAFYTAETIKEKLPSSVRSSTKIEKFLSFLETMPFGEERKLYTQFYTLYMANIYEFLLDKDTKRSVQMIAEPLQDPIIKPLFGETIDSMLKYKIAEIRGKVYVSKYTEVSNLPGCILQCNYGFDHGNYEALKYYIQSVLIDYLGFNETNATKKNSEKFGACTKKLFEKCPNDLKVLEWLTLYTKSEEKYQNFEKSREEAASKYEAEKEIEKLKTALRKSNSMEQNRKIREKLRLMEEKLKKISVKPVEEKESMLLPLYLKMVELLRKNSENFYYTPEQWYAYHFVIKEIGQYYREIQEYELSNAYLEWGLNQWAQIKNNPFFSFFDPMDLYTVQESYFIKPFHGRGFIATMTKNEEDLKEDKEKFRSILLHESDEKIMKKALTFSLHTAE